MHIILGLLSLVASVLWIVYLWQGLRGRSCGTNMRPAGQWIKPKKFADPLRLVNDPMEAAMLLMLAITASRGILTTGQRDAITGMAEKTFQLTPSQAEELYISSSHLLNQAPYPDKILKNMGEIISRSCSAAEKAECVAMLEAAAAAEGAPSDAQRAQIGQVKRILGLP